ncbi:MAG: B12-binding domain-containing radical SAM protein [Candidatus Saganbacteria bacterium]|nr:B12-binding domain-containing radical SAM protein [Candidatus Saganbacteria bacterium]
MKLVLITPNPKMYNSKGSFKKSLRYAPLTMTTLAALIPEELDIEVKIIDEGIEEIDFNLDADLIGITAISGTTCRAYEIADHFRSRGIPVVLGGVHPTLLPEEAMQHADSIVIGFAEQTFPQLLRDFKTGKMQKVYSPGKIVNLSNMPHPKRALLKKGSYITINTVQATRGCPNECDFCVTPIVCQGYHKRPIAEVIEEIKELKSKHVLFLDPSPMEDSQYAKELFKSLIPLKIHWAGLSTVNIGKDNELFDLIVKSGCRGLLIGFESVSQNSLDQIKKGFNNRKEYEKLIKRLHQNKIAINGTFIFGLDTDTQEVFRDTHEFICQNNIDLPRFTVYTPFVNTPAYKRLKAEGRILSEDWSLYDGQHVVIQPKNMSPQELQEGLYWAWEKTYSLKSILKRLACARCSLSFLIPANLGYRHYGIKLRQYKGIV